MSPRSVIATALVLTALSATSSLPAQAARPAASPYAAIVDARHRGPDGDTTSGTATYRTITAALAALAGTSGPAVLHGAGRAVVFVRNGRYREKLTIDRPRLTLRGESRDSTILTYDAYAGLAAPEGGRYGTRGSFTLRIVAPDFRAESMTIENAFDYAANAKKADTDSTKIRDTQGVALMLDAGSDRASFEGVRITGHQDTLFPNSGRSYFHGCEIIGSVDFIFGAGRAVFEECDIISRDRGSQTNNGYVTAPSTPARQKFGFLFLRSRLLKEKASMPANSVTLGRPWHPFGDPDATASAVFIECWMDDHIGEKGWDRMSATDSTGERVWYEPESARFFEFGTRGPGAVSSPRRRVLPPETAREFDVRAVLDDWVPAPPPRPAKKGD